MRNSNKNKFLIRSMKTPIKSMHMKSTRKNLLLVNDSILFDGHFNLVIEIPLVKENDIYSQTNKTESETKTNVIQSENSL